MYPCICTCRDEVNLIENEKIKKELNPMKIDEPNTPYLSPLDTDDELDVSPLSLSDGAKKIQVGFSGELERGICGDECEKEGLTYGRRRSMDEYYGQGISEDEEGGQEKTPAERKSDFVVARKSHYKIDKSILYDSYWYISLVLLNHCFDCGFFRHVGLNLYQWMIQKVGRTCERVCIR